MIIKSVKLNKNKLIFISLSFFLILIYFFIWFVNPSFILVSSKNTSCETSNTSESEKKPNYIKWVDFTPTCEVLSKTAKLDIDSHANNEDVIYNWIELLAYLGCKYGGNFKSFNSKDLNNIIEKLKSGTSMEELTKDLKYYNYYYEAYDAVLHEFIGEYEIEIIDSNTGEKKFIKKYGIKVFSPIAKNYNFNHYDDFGASRSYGYKREHLGNDLMGSIGTPIIAVESGVVEALGWNQYGGWRIGIRSLDGKRYYYYAHLRKDHPYAADLEEGQVVTAGDVIRIFRYDWI